MTPANDRAHRQRRATYRIQLRADFDFTAAAEQAGYLARLGISHVYCSPYTQAAAGSTHGYDVVDPTRVSAELGGDAGHRSMTEAFARAGLSQLLDIVPNHMSVADRRNRWWWDVLADGMASPYAHFFDIDWDVDDQRLRHRVLLPVLGDQIGRVLERGEIRLVREGSVPLVAYFDHRFPLRIETVVELVEAAIGPGTVLSDQLAALPAGTTPEQRARRHQLREQLSAAAGDILAGGGGAAALDAALDTWNADVSTLDRLLSEQHHRLARWQTGVEEVNYRRFFDITSLVALRTEDPGVFAAVSGLAAELVHRGDVEGLRVDHIDGLRRPLEYASRLRGLSGGDTWLLAEKILQRGEQLPPWSLDGTSGYDFLAIVNGLFVDGGARSQLAALHEEITGNPAGFAEYAYTGKREILTTTLLSDVDRLTSLLARICDAYPAHRDHTETELRETLIELVTAVPFYRTYVDPRHGPARAGDATIIRSAAGTAAQRTPTLDPRLLQLLVDLFLSGEPGDVATDETVALRHSGWDLVLRLQQLCAATMAKGVEDTACYRQLVLVSLNEVGDSPEHFGVTLDEFHGFNVAAQEHRPFTLLATSTHDTKRSEDVRCRIDAISTVPAEWAAAVRRWRSLNHRHWQVPPDAAMEYLLYQTLVGAWPIAVDRATAYMEKASREAKQRTSWLQPDEAYDAALRAFVEGVVADPDFVADLERFTAAVVPVGRASSLAMTLLKLTSPGVPDIYQGCELWDLSLVDPDNRRPVDYRRRAALLDAFAGRTVADAWGSDAASGAPKLLLIRDALDLRRRRAAAFDERGAYSPVRAEGPFSDDVVCFLRGEPAAVATIATRRLCRSHNLGDTMLTLPAGSWTNLLDGATHAGGACVLATLLGSLPVALLERSG